MLTVVCSTTLRHASYRDLLDIALTDTAWAEGEHILALSLILDTPVFVFSTFKRTIPPINWTVDPSRLQQHFRDHGQGRN